MKVSRYMTREEETRLFRFDKTLEYCDEIISMMKDVSYDEFFNFSMLAKTTIFNLEQISEHITRLSDFLNNNYPDPTWNKIIGLRIIIAHIYWKIDFAKIYEIATENVKPLRDSIQKIKNGLSKK